MPLPIYTIKCTKNEVIARDVYDVRFEKPAGWTFKPGQFVLFKVGLIEKPEDIQTRAFSLASIGAEPELIIVAKMKEGGRASRWIEEKLTVGMEVQMQGPFGNFLLDQNNPKELLFIATSTGIGPFRSQVIEALEGGDTRRMDLVFGVRNEEDLFWREEFEKLAQQYENFYVHFALSAPSESWKGHRGRVQTLVPLIVHGFANKNVYVCGSPDMTKDIKQLCLEQWGVDKKDLHVEGYI